MSADAGLLRATVLQRIQALRPPQSGDRMRSRPISITMLACCALSGFWTSVQGQVRMREVSMAAGFSQFDASGTGTAPVAALRVAAPLVSPWLLGDLNFVYASLDEQFSTTNTRIGVAEGQLQAQWPSTRIRPYLGLGGGWLHYFNNAASRPSTGPTLSAAAGLRVAAARMIYRGELRLRAWESAGGGYNNSAAEFTAGVGWAF